jgi:hypothetical protein
MEYGFEPCLCSGHLQDLEPWSFRCNKNPEEWPEKTTMHLKYFKMLFENFIGHIEATNVRNLMEFLYFHVCPHWIGPFGPLAIR